jgi:hypothetical protein
MRYLAWIAIFSLQLSIFVCEAGVDVCSASDVITHIETTQSTPTHDQHATDTPCSAHAAHTFLGQSNGFHGQSSEHRKPMTTLTSLSIPDFFKQIEQPPKA